MKNYIEFDDANYLWNSGFLTVFIDGQFVESIFIDDFPDLDMDELFKQLAKKYSITEELVYKEVNYYTR